MNSSATNAPIDLALAELSLQDVPNVVATAKKFNVVESTLRRRWKGETMSKKNVASEYHQRLINAQEEALIHQINRLTNRGIPPT